MSKVIISAQNLLKEYRMGEEIIHAVANVDIDIHDGDYVAITGPSGSGKSTFMNLIGALDSPTQGSLQIDGQELAKMSGDDLATLRNKKIGFVFQQFNLLSRQTALANVKMPLLYNHSPQGDEIERAKECLTMVGLGDRMDHLPTQLSGGQQQRVAIARALVNHPSILLADEPTGALDTKTSEEIMELLNDLNAKGITIILVTHEAEIAVCAKRQIGFRDGSVEFDRLTETGDAP
ncbi:ABC transporter ATP-binding protein [Temperatibacter marinus]|uniref:ABC transporter ATP-binding protein n=1 Tax=Temperatibacter marinus TaxID=1456591 RepID=A0AA52HBW9_9PROT|nr:ABC transporter ATP-binding protein [Temperatibacter marinus]WND04088.1 ABC transporter ATP-binding protein [Temperatibacter marinus]